MLLKKNRNSHPEVFCKKGVSQNSQENTCTKVSFLVLIRPEAQVLSCEFCEISKNTFFHRTPLVAASKRNKNPWQGDEPYPLIEQRWSKSMDIEGETQEKT